MELKPTSATSAGTSSPSLFAKFCTLEGIKNSQPFRAWLERRVRPELIDGLGYQALYEYHFVFMQEVTDYRHNVGV